MLPIKGNRSVLSGKKKKQVAVFANSKRGTPRWSANKGPAL